MLKPQACSYTAFILYPSPNPSVPYAAWFRSIRGASPSHGCRQAAPHTADHCPLTADLATGQQERQRQADGP